MPSGSLPLGEFNRDVVTVGITYFPDADIAVKADYVWLGNNSGILRSRSSFNLGLGWWF